MVKQSMDLLELLRSGALASADQPLQMVPIFRRQPYRIFLLNHRCRTSRTAV